MSPPPEERDSKRPRVLPAAFEEAVPSATEPRRDVAESKTDEEQLQTLHRVLEQTLPAQGPSSSNQVLGLPQGTNVSALELLARTGALQQGSCVNAAGLNRPAPAVGGDSELALRLLLHIQHQRAMEHELEERLHNERLRMLLWQQQRQLGQSSLGTAHLLPNNPLIAARANLMQEILQEQQQQPVVSNDPVQHALLRAILQRQRQQAVPSYPVPNQGLSTAADVGTSVAFSAERPTKTVRMPLPETPAKFKRASTAQPVSMSIEDDLTKLSRFQTFLRQQIEVFAASRDDTRTHTRGRNKPIELGQVGIRCRHCAADSVASRAKGSTYYPSSLQGLYQAAQNMSTTHMLSGVCHLMPDDMKAQFEELGEGKNCTSTGGRKYWAESGRQLGLVDTDYGIRFQVDMDAAEDSSAPSSKSDE